jgi:hypothetical protein
MTPLTRVQETAVSALHEFDPTTRAQVDTLLDLWRGRYLLEPADRRAIANHLVGWLSGTAAYPADRGHIYINRTADSRPGHHQEVTS